MKYSYKQLKIKEKSNWKNLIGEISKRNDEANRLLSEVKKTDETFDNEELVCTKTDRAKCDFNRFSLPLKFIEKIYNYKITLNEAIDTQTELKILMNNLNNDYNPRSSKKEKEKNRVLESAKKLLNMRDDIIDLFEKGIFPYKGNVFKTKESKESEENKLEKIKDDYKKISQIYWRWIISYELFKKHFNFVSPTVLVKKLYEIKNKKENKELVNKK